MPKNPKFDEARRKLDEALRDLSAPEPPSEGSTPERVGPEAPRPAPATRRAETAELSGPGRAGAGEALPETPSSLPNQVTGWTTSDNAPPPQAPGQDDHPSDDGQPAPPSEALVRLIVGAALLGLDGLDARSDDWEVAAGISRRRQARAAAEGEIGSGRFRHALIGWIFESEEQLRPRGNPISWLRAVVRYSFGTIFAVVIDLLPLPRFRRSRGTLSEPSDEETRRWVGRGLAEEERSRRFAQAAIEDIVDHAIIYLARRPAVSRALGEIVRSPAMDDAVHQILAGPAVEQATRRVAESQVLDEVIARVGRSPAINAVVSDIVRTPAMEDAVKYLVGTEAMSEAIDTLAKSPALVDLVTTQSTSVAAEILEEVRERAVSGDKLAESLVRRLLRRPPRKDLPIEARGLQVTERRYEPKP